MKQSKNGTYSLDAYRAQFTEEELKAKTAAYWDRMRSKVETKDYKKIQEEQRKAINNSVKRGYNT